MVSLSQFDLSNADSMLGHKNCKGIIRSQDLLLLKPCQTSRDFNKTFFLIHNRVSSRITESNSMIFPEIFLFFQDTTTE